MRGAKHGSNGEILNRVGERWTLAASLDAGD
jgi:hypothetical protein